MSEWTQERIDVLKIEIEEALKYGDIPEDMANDYYHALSEIERLQSLIDELVVSGNLIHDAFERAIKESNLEMLRKWRVLREKAATDVNNTNSE